MKCTFKRKEFCDGDCNNCETIRNPQLSLLMNVLTDIFGNDVIGITNAVCPNMICCADCAIDDMCHLVDDDGSSICNIEKEARKVANWYKKVNMNGRIDSKNVTLL